MSGRRSGLWPWSWCTNRVQAMCRVAAPPRCARVMGSACRRFTCMSRALPVFNDEQRERAQRLLAYRVAHMMGRKLEEADWTDVYAAALGIKPSGWSNLDIDIMHGHLGVEQKALRYRGDRIEEACGTTRMHPSLTRSIRIDPNERDPEVAKEQVFRQYASLVRARRSVVARQNRTDRDVEMRSGWLLWQDTLRQFLYFEELMRVPSPDDYHAEWRASGREDGRRKPSKNLWIYERATGQKRYSVTTEAGAKIQPYFDVPRLDDPNLYIFTVIGEPDTTGKVRAWISTRTATELDRVVGSLVPADIERVITQAIDDLAQDDIGQSAEEVGEVTAVKLSAEVYGALAAAIPGANDDHRFQLLLDYLRSRD
jgi:hypothetical protein